MTDLIFYTHPMSRGRIIRWMMEEVGQPYDTQILGFEDSMKSPAYLSVNPMGKVPAIKHGDTVVTECGAICAYLADAFPQTGLAPAHGSKDRGPYYRWLFFAAGPVEQAVGVKSMGWETPPERERMLGFGSMDHVLDALEGALDGRDYLAGDTFTAADLYVASHLSWGMQFGTIEKRPNFERYVALHTGRPAAKRAAEIDDALIAAQQPAE
ncbi:MAG: glutathione S-transferase family protein [Alphaproteobacteria bacterium]|nr:glutathione S-transferase family protein [Alphaproteobacteria bacterium]MBU1515805.1 glutathione S-transferase family protein [Alphaproteobacteria bacterium]MBU2094027.1 glutathione S-transferase family protein [Alphaproteobacteria bacterium]MBU2152626.1 glutathione S-transferase family protein [Alphaproteobacteria bacterium]MBU2308827.1 glutathione S-transferase family protein [Alphaproteobacteria bacterium]